MSRASLCAVSCAALLLSACKPTATDDYIARIGIDERHAPSAPIPSPDTKGAAWVPSGANGRLVYGKPGAAPLMALACAPNRAGPRLVYTRFAPADADAQAVLALIGNGHVTRFWIDAAREGGRWLWRGEVAADDPGLEALSGGRQVEATVPGAGSLILNPSRLPGELIARCAASAPRAPSPPAGPA